MFLEGLLFLGAFSQTHIYFPFDVFFLVAGNMQVFAILPRFIVKIFGSRQFPPVLIHFKRTIA